MVLLEGPGGCNVLSTAELERMRLCCKEDKNVLFRVRELTSTCDCNECRAPILNI